MQFLWPMLVSIVEFLKCSSIAPIGTYSSYLYSIATYSSTTLALLVTADLVWSVLGSVIHQFLLLGMIFPSQFEMVQETTGLCGAMIPRNNLCCMSCIPSVHFYTDSSIHMAQVQRFALPS